MRASLPLVFQGPKRFVLPISEREAVGDARQLRGRVRGVACSRNKGSKCVWELEARSSMHSPPAPMSMRTQCMRMSARETWCVVLAWLPDAGCGACLCPARVHLHAHRCVRRRGHCTCGYAGMTVSRCSQLRFRLLGLGAKEFVYAHVRVPPTHTPHTQAHTYHYIAQVAMGKKISALGSNIPSLARVPAGSDVSITALCAFSIWCARVRECESEREAWEARAR